MIAARDLCIGNWVYDGERTQFPMFIRAIGEDYVYLDFEGNEGDLWESKPEDLQGIPLTPELLEKMGAEKVSSKKNDTTLMRLCSYTLTTSLNLWIVFEGNADIRTEVRYNTPQLVNMGTSYSVHYLHELQNLFWNITKQELKVNLWNK